MSQIINEQPKKKFNLIDVLELSIKQLKFRKGMTIKRIWFWSIDVINDLEDKKLITSKEGEDLLNQLKESQKSIGLDKIINL